MGWAGEGCRRSLRQVVEADRHADVAREADVDAEVDQSLSPWAWRDERNMLSLFSGLTGNNGSIIPQKAEKEV